MTPLAHEIAKDKLKPLREQRWRGVESPAEADVPFAFFDVTAVQSLIESMYREERLSGGSPADRAFLPMPATWVEYVAAGGVRNALVMLQSSDEIGIFLVQQDIPGALVPIIKAGGGDLSFATKFHYPTWATSVQEKQDIEAILAIARGALAFINTPRFLRREVHPGHAGLARALRQSGRVPQAWRAPEWTEIKLSVLDARAASEIEAAGGLSSPKALHMVRAHLRRLADGRVIPVKSHYRGDVTKGVKLSTYRVVPPAA